MRMEIEWWAQGGGMSLNVCLCTRVSVHVERQEEAATPVHSAEIGTVTEPGAKLMAGKSQQPSWLP